MIFSLISCSKDGYKNNKSLSYKGHVNIKNKSSC
jgi:hypothetical protein